MNRLRSNGLVPVLILLCFSFLIYCFSFGFLTKGGHNQNEEDVLAILTKVELVSVFLVLFSLLICPKILRFKVFVLTFLVYLIGILFHIQDRVDFFLQEKRLESMYIWALKDYENKKKGCCVEDSQLHFMMKFEIRTSKEGWIACIYSPWHAQKTAPDFETRSYIKLEEKYKEAFASSFPYRKILHMKNNWYVLK